MKLSIIQQNVDGWQFFRNLINPHEFNTIIDKLYNEDPDILLLSGVYYKKMLNIIKRKFKGYEFFFPKAATNDDQKSKNIYAACVIIYKKKSVTFDKEKTELPNMLALRYICGKFYTNKTTIDLLFLYIPQTYKMQFRRKSKKNMLNSAKEYVENNSENRNLLIIGDMNSDIDNKNTSSIKEFEALYNLLEDTDLDKLPTWGNHRFDYSLISKNSSFSAKTHQLVTPSNHKGLKTIITLNNE